MCFGDGGLSGWVWRGLAGLWREGEMRGSGRSGSGRCRGWCSGCRFCMRVLLHRTGVS